MTTPLWYWPATIIALVDDGSDDVVQVERSCHLTQVHSGQYSQVVGHHCMQEVVRPDFIVGVNVGYRLLFLLLFLFVIIIAI
jgi:hypothetical protein